MAEFRKRIALVSAPWPLFNRPSIQLGALKAFLSRNLPDITVDALHLYLPIAAEIGYDLYQEISERTWLSEIPYAALLYPQKQNEQSVFFDRRLRGTDIGKTLDLDTLGKRLHAATDRILGGIDWGLYSLVGFSICLGQLMSSLWCIKKIRQRAPRVKILVGGSCCASELGESLLRSFEEIDFVINGEGERPLAHLAAEITQKCGLRIAPFPGLLQRDEELPAHGAFSQVPSLDSLPVPDFDDYLQALQGLPPHLRFIPKLPMEISRGCWWRGTAPTGKDRGCRFCNLNLQWKGYRTKSPQRVAQELDGLARTHQILSVSFMDNLLPTGTSKAPFDTIAALGKDFQLFGETRATTSKEDLRSMAAAGVREVQVGIEALSTSLLRKIGKGTTAVMNLEIMKRCETPGMPRIVGNLILEFPGSDERDVRETLRALDFATVFQPMKAIPFWLGFKSPVWQDPRAYGIQRVFNHPYYRHLFPKERLKTLTLMIQGFHGGVLRQRRLWRPVQDRARAWAKAYAALHGAPQSGPILSYRDGGTFLILKERRRDAAPMNHRVQGTSREIYLYCDTTRSFEQISKRFPGLGEEKLRPFLSMMVGKKLMYEERDHYLSLAVPAHPRPASH